MTFINQNDEFSCGSVVMYNCKVKLGEHIPTGYLSYLRTKNRDWNGPTNEILFINNLTEEFRGCEITPYFINSYISASSFLNDARLMDSDKAFILTHKPRNNMRGHVTMCLYSNEANRVTCIGSENSAIYILSLEEMMAMTSCGFVNVIMIKKYASMNNINN